MIRGGEAATCTYQFPDPIIASFSLPILSEADAVAENDLAWNEGIRGDTRYARNDLGAKADWGVGMRRERNDVNVLVGMLGERERDALGRRMGASEDMVATRFWAGWMHLRLLAHVSSWLGTMMLRGEEVTMMSRE